MVMNPDECAASRALLVLDTNTFLHYRSFDEVPWTDLAPATRVTLCITPVVVRELNKHKDSHRSRKLRERAATVLARLDSLVDQGMSATVRPGVTLDLVPNEPDIDFKAEHLSDDCSDDQLIAAVLAIAREHPDCRVILVTHDIGLKMKARPRELPILPLPEALKLPPAKDPSEVRIRELEEEIRKLQLAIPKLRLCFLDDSDRQTFEIGPAPDSLLKKLTQQRDEANRACVELAEPPGVASRGSAAGSPPGFEEQAPEFAIGPSVEQIREYNKKVRRFRRRHEQYIVAALQYVETRSRTIGLHLMLVNEGSAPANDIDLRLHFPDGFALLSENELPGEPRPPEPPELPTLAGQFRQFLKALSSIPTFLDSLPDLGPLVSIFKASEESKPRIRRSNSYDVDFKVIQLKHHMLQQLDSLYVVFDSIDTAQSFQVDYVAIAASTPDPVQGKLHVIIAKPS